MFQNVDAYAGDPIPSLMETFRQDLRADKINLSINSITTSRGQILAAGLGQTGHGGAAGADAAGESLPADGRAGNLPQCGAEPAVWGRTPRCCRPGASPPSRAWAARGRSGWCRFSSAILTIGEGTKKRMVIFPAHQSASEALIHSRQQRQQGQHNPKK